MITLRKPKIWIRPMKKNHILLIDDDKELAELLCEFLGDEGFHVSCCYDGVSGLAKAFDENIDLIMLDVMMPKLNGFEVLKALGGEHKVPILMLTAKGDDDDRILGLELGADDYLAKPFHHKELLARINAIFRRIDIVKRQHDDAPTSPNETLNNVRLNHASREAFCHDNLVELTGTEYQMLNYLIKHADNVVSKNSLSEEILHRKLSPFDRNIDMHVSNIRRKLLQFCETDKIKTIRGSGYIFLTGDGNA